VEGKRVVILLNTIGDKTYVLLRNYFAPEQLSEQTLDHIKEVLKRHFEHTKIVIAERFHFHRRRQAEGESVADYVAELRKLFTSCQFGNYLEQALRDRFVCGYKSENAQKKLLLSVVIRTCLNLTEKKRMLFPPGFY